MLTIDELQKLLRRGNTVELDASLQPGAAGEIELSPDGGNRDVDLANLGEYVQRVLDVFLLEGVRAQLAAFSAGFSAALGSPPQ